MSEDKGCKHGCVKNTCTACYDEARLRGMEKRIVALKSELEEERSVSRALTAKCASSLEAWQALDSLWGKLEAGDVSIDTLQGLCRKEIERCGAGEELLKAKATADALCSAWAKEYEKQSPKNWTPDPNLPAQFIEVLYVGSGFKKELKRLLEAWKEANRESYSRRV